MASGRWSQHLRALRGWFPLTFPGLLMIAGSAGAFYGFGVLRQDLILFIVGIVGLILSGWCLVATCIGAIWTWARLRELPPVRPVELECGRPFSVDFRPPRLWGLPFVSRDWRWVAPEVDVVTTPRGEQITPRRRGVYDRIHREIEIGDVFGVANVRFSVVQPATMRFVPATGALRDVKVIQGLSGGDLLGHPEGDPVGDRIDMRRYGDGDPIRYVLWKVYARRRELMVRTPERAFSPARQTVAYLVTGEADDAAAGAARVAVESGALGRAWRLGADGTPQIAEDTPHAMDLIVRSAQTPLQDAAQGLSTFLQRADVSPKRRAMVFVPPTPGPWLSRVAAAAGDERLEFLVCVDGVSRRPKPSTLRRWLLQPDPTGDRAGVDWEGLQEVLRTLHRSGGQVTVIDRAAGQAFPAEQLRRR